MTRHYYFGNRDEFDEFRLLRKSCRFGFQVVRVSENPRHKKFFNYYLGNSPHNMKSAFRHRD